MAIMAILIDMSRIVLVNPCLNSNPPNSSTMMADSTTPCVRTPMALGRCDFDIIWAITSTADNLMNSDG